MNADTASSGKVTYNVINSGREEHEMVLLRTDLDPASLPVDNAGKVLESAQGIVHVEEVDKLPLARRRA